MRRKFRVLKARGGKDASSADFGKENFGGGDGRNPSLQYEKKTILTQESRDRLNKQNVKGRQTISPSTSLGGQALKYGLMFSGIPLAGALSSKILDTGTSMGYGKNNKTKNNKIKDGGDGMVSQKKILPIQATKAIDTTLINPKDNFFKFKSYNVGGLSGGVSYGPPPKRGPNPQVPPVKMKRGGHK
jgi:hypothetical protein|tara:strand:- start:6 stop:566 length:561 start_codon:yes stop_codon:yes gene_type:complete